MKLNFSKTKFITFNSTINFDFEAGLTLGDKEIESVDQMKLLGLTVTNDLKWRTNTHEMVKKAYSKLWILKRLKKKGASLDDLKDVYIKQVRNILEFGVPVWNCGITLEEVTDIERVQKAFLYITLGEKYYRYESALEEMELETLEERRLQLYRTFATR